MGHPSWNRYASVANKPLSFTDPLGLYKDGPGQCSVPGDSCGGGGDLGDGGGGGGPADGFSGDFGMGEVSFGMGELHQTLWVDLDCGLLTWGWDNISCFKRDMCFLGFTELCGKGGGGGGADGIGGGGAGGQRSPYTVNLKILNKCLGDLQIPVTINSFTPSTPGGFGSATGIGTDLFSFKGANSTITVKNDAKTYNAVQVGALCNLPAALGCTNPSSPYTNFTNNNNSAFGTVTTQIHELGHSLFDIAVGVGIIPEPGGRDIGRELENCVKKNHGIQRN